MHVFLLRELKVMINLFEELRRFAILSHSRKTKFSSLVLSLCMSVVNVAMCSEVVVGQRA